MSDELGETEVNKVEEQALLEKEGVECRVKFFFP